MISYLKGILIEKTPTRVIVEVGGIGLEAAISLSSYNSLGTEGDTVKLMTYLHVREDALQLFGFTSAEERELFLHLISVTGIGPKLAQGILSGTSPNEFKNMIITGDIDAISTMRGVGKKTAQRLVVDLREKFGEKSAQVPDIGSKIGNVERSTYDETLLALMSLGYTRMAAQNILEKTLVASTTANKQTSVEELLKMALKNT